MDRSGIFAGTDPFQLTKDWLASAQDGELNDPNAIALATVDTDGMPNARVVLLKDIEADAFVFYTNYTSAKAQELDNAGKAAFVMHWKSLRRQVRERGIVEKEDGPAPDAYYNSRSLNSRLGAWASQQSQPLENRAALEEAFKAEQERHGDTPKRPPFWGGYRIQPLEMEFWADGDARLHNRFKWTRATLSDPWTIVRLNP